jgi:glycosyltransferase involved in cell wall biosynthesis
MIDVILPVLNERQALPWVLELMPDGYRPLVVDNGSDDGSAELAEVLGASVVREPRRGFGAACWAGLSAASSEVVCFMDCDGSLRPDQLPLIAEPVADRQTDLCLGARDARAGGWPWHARVANRALAADVRRRTGLQIRDLGPMRAARRASLLALGLEDRGFGWPLEMVLRAAAAGWRVEEVTVSYLPRTGRSKVTGTARGTLRAVRDMTGVLRGDWRSDRQPEPHTRAA